MAGASSGALELAAADELADAVEGDAEDAGGLVCGEVAGADDLRLHAASVLERAVGACT